MIRGRLSYLIKTATLGHKAAAPPLVAPNQTVVVNGGTQSGRSSKCDVVYVAAGSNTVDVIDALSGDTF